MSETPTTYRCPECPATFTDGKALWDHHTAHIEADWRANKDALTKGFVIPDEEITP